MVRPNVAACYLDVAAYRKSEEKAKLPLHINFDAPRAFRPRSCFRWL
jgi:hypothetical protein